MTMRDKIAAVVDERLAAIVTPLLETLDERYAQKSAAPQFGTVVGAYGHTGGLSVQLDGTTTPVELPFKGTPPAFGQKVRVAWVDPGNPVVDGVMGGDCHLGITMPDMGGTCSSTSWTSFGSPAVVSAQAGDVIDLCYDAQLQATSINNLWINVITVDSGATKINSVGNDDAAAYGIQPWQAAAGEWRVGGHYRYEVAAEDLDTWAVVGLSDTVPAAAFQLQFRASAGGGGPVTIYGTSPGEAAFTVTNLGRRTGIIGH